MARALLDLPGGLPTAARPLIRCLESSVPLVVSRRKQLEFPPGTLDVRGWQVHAELGGQRAGTVEDLLVDGLGRPLYFEVQLDSFARHVLVPLSRVHADPAGQVVWVEGMSLDQFARVPEYALDPTTLTPAYELRLIECYEGFSLDQLTRSP